MTEKKSFSNYKSVNPNSLNTVLTKLSGKGNFNLKSLNMPKI